MLCRTKQLILISLFCNQRNGNWRRFICLISRFAQLEELDWAFGTMERKIKANIWLLYTLDISDFIVECVDANFGFSRYAERLGRSANFLTSYTKLYSRATYIDFC
jgi:hypothetical protein